MPDDHSLAADLPQLLWHYTTFAGLQGIITGSELFASSLAYLNDTTEFQYTTRRVSILLDTSGVALGDLVRGLGFDNVNTLVKEMFTRLRGQGIYAMCLSREPDDLSQWRSYTPQPPGFALGFHPHELEAHANAIGFSLESCKYPSTDELDAEVKAALGAATKGMDEEKAKLPMPTPQKELVAFKEKWAVSIIAKIIEIAVTRKHPKFAAEKEVRLIGHAGPVRHPLEQTVGNASYNVHYRLSGTLIVPYIKIPARPKDRPSPIKAILVGPCPHQLAVIEATRQMCVCTTTCGPMCCRLRFRSATGSVLTPWITTKLPIDAAAAIRSLLVAALAIWGEGSKVYNSGRWVPRREAPCLGLRPRESGR